MILDPAFDVFFFHYQEAFYLFLRICKNFRNLILIHSCCMQSLYPFPSHLFMSSFPAYSKIAIILIFCNILVFFRLELFVNCIVNVFAAFIFLLDHRSYFLFCDAKLFLNIFIAVSFNMQTIYLFLQRVRLCQTGSSQFLVILK